MSNQVYSNAVDKYLPQPGINGFILAANVPLAANGGIATPVALPFDTDALVEVPGLVVAGSTKASVTSRGLYAIQYTVACQYTIPTTQEADLYLALVISDTGTGWDGVPVSVGALRIEPRQGVIGSDVRYLTVSYTGYLPSGGSVSAQLQNLAPFPMSVLAAQSKMIFSKLA